MLYIYNKKQKMSIPILDAHFSKLDIYDVIHDLDLAS